MVEINSESPINSESLNRVTALYESAVEEIERLRKEVAEFKWASGQVNRAIKSKDLDPLIHEQVASRHRQEWVTLWRAIDHLIDTYEKSYLQD